MPSHISLSFCSTGYVHPVSHEEEPLRARHSQWQKLGTYISEKTREQVLCSNMYDIAGWRALRSKAASRAIVQMANAMMVPKVSTRKRLARRQTSAAIV